MSNLFFLVTLLGICDLSICSLFWRGMHRTGEHGAGRGKHLHLAITFPFKDFSSSKTKQ